MDTHSIGWQKHYLITGGCALLSLFSCMFLPFVEVSNESTLSSHPLIFTGMELTGSNWLNLILSIGILIIVAKFTLRPSFFEFKEKPLATQEYWAKRTVITIALLCMLVNIWAFFNIKQIFDAYSQTDNLYSVKPMIGCGLILICMAVIVANNILLNRVEAPAKNLAESVNPAAPVERRNTPQNSAGYPLQQQRPTNYPIPQAPAAGYQAGSQGPSSQSMPAPTGQPPVQQRPVKPPAPMPMQPAAQQRPANPPAPMQQPMNQPAPMPMQPAAQQRPANPPAPMSMNQPVPQQPPAGQSIAPQRPFSLPALPQTPPIQPAIQQKPVNPPPAAPQPVNAPAAPQSAGQSIAPQRPFSLPALPSTPSAQPAAKQMASAPAPNTPVFPMPVGKSIKQQLPLSLPGLPQTPPIQQAVQQKPANPSSAAPQPANAPATPPILRPAGQSIAPQRPFSLPALPGTAPVNPVAPNAQLPAQPGKPPAPQQNKPGNPKSQFMKPPSQA
jgi:Ca2+/Na+ antiporter